MIGSALPCGTLYSLKSNVHGILRPVANMKCDEPNHIKDASEVVQNVSDAVRLSLFSTLCATFPAPSSQSPHLYALGLSTSLWYSLALSYPVAQLR